MRKLSIGHLENKISTISDTNNRIKIQGICIEKEFEKLAEKVSYLPSNNVSQKRANLIRDLYKIEARMKSNISLSLNLISDVDDFLVDIDIYESSNNALLIELSRVSKLLKEVRLDTNSYLTSISSNLQTVSKLKMDIANLNFPKI